jgi:hypothetical protein
LPALTTQCEVIQFFESRFPDAFLLMPQLADNYFANPTGAMVTIKCSPWHVEGKSAASRRCGSRHRSLLRPGNKLRVRRLQPVWSSCLTGTAQTGRVFREFEKERKVNTDAIADMAIENFTEMRDRVADARFLFRKKVELALEARYPNSSCRSMPWSRFIAFRTPSLWRAATVQDRILAELCESIDRVEDLDWDKADRLIRRDLTPLEFDGSDNENFTKFQPSEDFAIAMDERDPLKEYRERFLLPKTADGDCVYLCGHSLGLQPKTAAAYVEQELKDWAQLGVEGHFHAKNPWMPYHRLLTEQTAELVGAKPLEVVVMNSLTVNLHLMMVSFYRPTERARHKIVVERGAFPSDQYAVQVADSFSWL